MNKRAIEPVIIVLIVVGIVLSFFVIGKGDLQLFSIAPTPGAVQIQNPSTGGYDFNYPNTNSFLCDADECIVSGSMVLDKVLNVPKVVVRYNSAQTSNSEIALAIDTGNGLEGHIYQSSGSKRPADGVTVFKYTTKDNIYKYIFFETSAIFVYDATSGTAHYKRYANAGSSNCGLMCDSNIKNYFSETTDTVVSYANATFNFCPNNDPGFAYCSGTANTVTTQGTAFTTEKLIKRDESVNFNPKYSDNSPVENFNIKVQKYDLSCVKNLISPTNPGGTTCSLGQKYCTPVITSTTTTCPSRYTFQASSCCIDTSGDYVVTANQCYKYIASSGAYNICGYGPYGNCINPTITQGSSDYTKYKQCGPAKQPFGQSSCTVFDTTLSCPTGQNCYLFNSAGTITSNTGSGLGDCSCPNGVCANNQRKKISETEYQQCISVGSCLDWSSTRTCAEGLIFDETRTNSLGTKGDCICNPINTCSPNEAECISKNSLDIRSCGSVTRGNKTCYEWKSPTNCLGDKRCFDRNDAIKNDICSCENINKCTTSQIKCININNYQSCSYGTDTNSCLDYRGSTPAGDGFLCDLTTNTLKVKDGCRWDSLRGTTTCTSTQQCVENDPSYPDGICKNSGCAYDTSGTECSTQKDANNQLVEACDKIASSNSFNTCAIIQDSNTATINDLSKTRCNPNLANQVQKVTHYSTSKNADIYRWEKAQDCQTNYFCSQDGNTATCLICSQLKDSRGTYLETKINNKCVLTSDAYTATSDMINQIKCSGNNLDTIYYVKTYTDTSITPNKVFYRWEPKTDAPDTTNGVCNSGFVCKSGNCQVGSFVVITSTNNYGVDELINGIKVSIGQDVPEWSNVRITARLLHVDGTAVKDANNQPILLTTYVENGQKIIDFNFANPNAERLKLEVFAGDVNSQYKSYVYIDIKKRLRVTLNCPIAGVIDRDVVCTFKITERSGSITTEQTIPANPVFTTSPELAISTSGDSFSFKSSVAGTVSVTVSASYPDYLSDSQTIPAIKIESPKFQQTLLIDDKDFATYINGVPKGQRNIGLRLSLSGLPAPVEGLQAIMLNPSGFEDTLSFIKSENTWNTQYNFLQPGYPYKMNVKAVFTDGSTQDLSYTITPSNFTEDITGQFNVIIALAIAGGLVLVVVIVLVALKLRNKNTTLSSDRLT